MSNDQTKDDLTTQPRLETVLERINAVGETLTSRMNEIADDVAQLRTDMEKRFDAVDQQFSTVGNEVASLRKGVEQGFRRVERKIDLLNKDFLAMRGDQEEMLTRIEELENKAS